VRTIVVHNKDGLVRLAAYTYIDATGDADLAVRARAAESGLHQAMSLRFMLGEVDGERLVRFLRATFEGCENAFISSYAPMIDGVELREALRRQGANL
jgi:hypothetical protein